MIHTLLFALLVYQVEMETCSPGYFLSGSSTCYSCLTYFYCPGDNEIHSCVFGNCEKCMPGTYMIHYAKKSHQPRECPVCYAGSAPSAQMCTPSPPGTYVQKNGACSYEYCSCGKYNPNTGSSTSSDCIPCPIGDNQLLCCIKLSLCPAATTVRQQDYAWGRATSLEDCIECPIGTYNYATCQHSDCFQCSKGKYCPSKGLSYPVCCPVGTFNPNSGATNSNDCLDCPPGTYQKNSCSEGCILCPAGTANPGQRGTHCPYCNEGTYSIEGSTECLSCPENSYSISPFTECYCVYGTHQNPNTEVLECLSDIPFCKIVNVNTNTCSQCINNTGVYFENGICVCNTTSYYQFVNTTTSEYMCEPCSKLCLSCFGPSESECTSCIPGTILNINKCECNSGTYFNESETEPALYCVDCDPLCKSCFGSSNNCSVCIDHPGVILTESRCECRLNEGYFLANINGFIDCSPCYSLCSSCTGPMPNECTKCIDDASIKFILNSICICAPGYYEDVGTGACAKCHPFCAECYDGTNTNCPLCNSSVAYPVIGHALLCVNNCHEISGYYFDGIQCANCDNSCRSCNGQGASNCITSQAPQKQNLCKNESLVSLFGTCVENCAYHYFPNEGVCEKCHETCGNCESGDSHSCIDCTKELLFYKGSCIKLCPKRTTRVGGECVTCMKNCENCIDANICISCEKGYYSLKNQSECFASGNCPEGTYQEESTMTCTACNIHCSTCFGPTKMDCLKCNVDQGYIRKSGTSLCTLKDCSYGQYLHSGEGLVHCKNCDPACETCNGEGPENCLTCNFGYRSKETAAGRVLCATCETLMKGYYTASSGECKEICGDGINLGQVECDDGNKKNGDGCSANCKVETGFSCAPDSSFKDICVDILPPSFSVKVESRNILILKFSEFVYSNFSSAQFSEFIGIRLEPLPTDCEFSYSLRDSVNARERFKTLTYDTKIKCSLRGKLPKFVVKFKNTAVLFDAANNSLKNHEVRTTTLPQTYLSEATKEAINSSGSTLQFAGIGSILLMLVILAFHSLGVSSFWSFLNLVQLISFLPYLSCAFPLLLKIFIKDYLLLGNFRIPFNAISFSPSEWFDCFEAGVVSDKLDSVNLNSVSSLVNLSDDITTWGLLTLFYLLLHLLTRCIPETTFKLLHEWKQDFEYNAILRILIEGFLPICFSSMINLYYFDISTLGNFISTLFSIIFLYICTAFLMFSFHLCNKSIVKLRNEKFQQKYSTIIEGIDTSCSPLTLSHTPFFLFRRLLFAAILVILPEYPLGQIIILIFFITIPMLRYFSVVRPFSSLSGNIINIYNEAVLLFILVNLLIFNFFSVSEKNFNILCWVMIVLIFISLMIAWVTMIIEGLQRLCSPTKPTLAVSAPRIGLSSENHLVAIQNSSVIMNVSGKAKNVTFRKRKKKKGKH